VRESSPGWSAGVQNPDWFALNISGRFSSENWTTIENKRQSPINNLENWSWSKIFRVHCLCLGWRRDCMSNSAFWKSNQQITNMLTVLSLRGHEIYEANTPKQWVIFGRKGIHAKVTSKTIRSEFAVHRYYAHYFSGKDGQIKRKGMLYQQAFGLDSVSTGQAWPPVGANLIFLQTACQFFENRAILPIPYNYFSLMTAWFYQ